MSNEEGNVQLVSVRTLASDDMLIVRRIEQWGFNVERRAKRRFPKGGFRDGLGKRLSEIEDIFTDGGWPPLWRRVFVSSQDEMAWDKIPSTWEKAWMSEGVDPMFECGRETPYPIEWGAQFILRRVEPLKEGHWLILEALAIRRVLDAPHTDQAVEAAHALGELHEQAHLHGLHLPAVRRRRKQLNSLKRDVDGARAKKIRERVTKAEKWHSIARETAAKYPASKGKRLEQHVNRELERQGLSTMSGRSIRRVLPKS